jgi:hypothetical protein
VELLEAGSLKYSGPLGNKFVATGIQSSPTFATGSDFELFLRVGL